MYQYKIAKEEQKTKNRSKNIFMYDFSLGHYFQEGLANYLQKQNNTFIWADFGSGNEIALREAHHYLNRTGFYSVDILQRDNHDKIYHDLSHSFRKIPSRWSGTLQKIPLQEIIETLSQEIYAPNHIREDISTVKLPEKADLITASWVFMYNRDVTEIFENAVDNLKDGGTVIFNTIYNGAIPELRSIRAETGRVCYYQKL